MFLCLTHLTGPKHALVSSLGLFSCCFTRFNSDLKNWDNIKIKTGKKDEKEIGPKFPPRNILLLGSCSFKV